MLNNNRNSDTFQNILLLDNTNMFLNILAEINSFLLEVSERKSYAFYEKN
tara:strand:- start:222 stop:371 length:150 start_codon:yes stop_codon:yes gene_type:complete